jgi:hypothetical protein
MKRFVFVLCILSGLAVRSQQGGPKFLEHLFKNSLYSEAESYLLSSQFPGQHENLKDYSLAICYKKIGKPDLFQERLWKIEKSNPLFFNARLWLQNFYLQKERFPELKNSFFEDLTCPDSLKKIQQLNKCAFYALQREYDNFYKVIAEAGPSSAYSSNIRQIETSMLRVKNFKKRKPFVGALLSAIIPGMGKIYAKKPKQGISSLITVAVFAVQAIEMYRHGGFKNTGFYVYGGVFTAFYLGNILGGAHAVKKYNYDFIRTEEYEILQQANYPYNRAGLY